MSESERPPVISYRTPDPPAPTGHSPWGIVGSVFGWLVVLGAIAVISLILLMLAVS